jgi:tetratricopeptide (TPR) repeat protein
MARKRTKTKHHNRPSPYSPDDTLVLVEYDITNEPIKDAPYRRLLQQIQEESEQLYAQVFRQPQQAIPRLEALIERYPDAAQFYNYLAVAYSGVQEHEKAEVIIRTCIQKHPTYLFAKLNLAELYLQRREYAKIAAIFNHKLELKLLYPRRKIFHISEVVNFAGTLGLYFAKIGERAGAEVYYKLLQQVAPGERMTKRLKRELYPSVLRRLVNKLRHSGGIREEAE